VLISWVNLPPDHPIVEFLYSVTEPILGPIRNVMPRTGMFDLSPIVAIILIELLRTLLVSLLGGLR
jgi:YggT family protein